jgi:nucleotide-binding universal stress UspA family protein
MFEHVLIGYDGTERAEDALALAGVLTGPHGRVTAACSFWFEPLTARVAPVGPWQTAMREDAEAVLAPLAARGIATEAILGTSPARALHEFAESERVDAIVLGPSHRGRVGRAVAGSTAGRLLHGAPCAVAIAPAGYRERVPESLHRIGVAFQPTQEGRAAVHAARKLAEREGGVIALLEAFDPNQAFATAAAVPIPTYVKDVREQIRGELDDLIGLMPEGLPIHGEILEGDPVHVLAERAGALDLLVLGSRGYGPILRVLLGSVSHRLVADAPCPVLVVPRPVAQANGGVPAHLTAGISL